MGNNMIERLRNIQLNKKQQDTLFYLSLVMLGLFVFLFVGSREPVLFDDSAVYMEIEVHEGVMPIYPVFLLLNQAVFGAENYLQAVVVEQAVWAVVCIVLFVGVVKNTFSLKYWEGYIAFCLSLLPFTIDMPQAMTTQEILTEGIAYALFYLFVIVLLKTVWTGRYTWLAGSFLMVTVFSMVRSQMQILYAVCGLLFLYIFLRGRKRRKTAAVILRLVLGAAGCALIMLLGVVLISRLTAGYKAVIQNHGRFYEFALRIQKSEEYPEEQEVVETVSEEELDIWSFTSSQYVSLIFSRGMYEADPEDVALFDDEVLKGLYLALYEAADGAKQRYIYEQKGLWMWKDIVGGIGMVGKTCLAVPSEYYAAYHPEIILSDQFSDIRNEHLMTIGMTLLKAHFGRFLYHTLMLLPSAFICTVFFQIAPIYGLCHIITLFLYVTAIGLMIWGYRDERVDNKYADFMALVLVTNVVMVVIISIVFFGQQRYLVYNFGMFYVAYGLLLEQLWKCRLRDRIYGGYRNR